MPTKRFSKTLIDGTEELGRDMGSALVDLAMDAGLQKELKRIEVQNNGSLPNELFAPLKKGFEGAVKRTQ